MEKKQTAVEFLIDQLESKGESWENVSIGRIQISIKVEDYLELQKQAKEMEKEQIIDANIAGQMFIGACPGHYKNDAEEYYNDTFKQD